MSYHHALTDKTISLKRKSLKSAHFFDEIKDVYHNMNVILSCKPIS